MPCFHPVQRSQADIKRHNQAKPNSGKGLCKGLYFNNISRVGVGGVKFDLQYSLVLVIMYYTAF